MWVPWTYLQGLEPAVRSGGSNEKMTVLESEDEEEKNNFAARLSLPPLFTGSRDVVTAPFWPTALYFFLLGCLVCFFPHLVHAWSFYYLFMCRGICFQVVAFIIIIIGLLFLFYLYVWVWHEYAYLHGN